MHLVGGVWNRVSEYKWTLKMVFHILGVALYCLLGACPVFVAGTGREISSPYIDEPGIFSIPYLVSMSILCNNYFWFHSVPECSGFSSIP